jgi:hypothetical protein
LTRDFRSWAYSRSIRTHKPFVWLAARWFAENIKLEHRLKKMNIDFLNVGYEELALFPDITLTKICEWAGIDFDDKMLNPANSKSHIIAGNIVRADKQKRSKIIYDARWLTAFKPVFWAFFFMPFFNKFNKKRVYSNLLNKKLKPNSFVLFNSKRNNEFKTKFN